MKYPRPYKRNDRDRFYSFTYRDSDRKRHVKSTGCERMGDAQGFVLRFIDSKTSRRGSMSFEEYQRPFFHPESCPRYARFQDDGRSMGLSTLANYRKWLDRYVLPDTVFCRKPMNEVTRGDILDLRKRIRTSIHSLATRHISGEGLNTLNKVIAVVGVVFSEAHFREDIPSSPASKIGDVRYERLEAVILTLEEIARIFGRPWNDALACDVLRFAALTGMRLGEIIGLFGRQLSGDVLRIDSAFKDRQRYGLPKWGKIRTITLCPEAAEILRRRMRGPDDLVFTRDDGRRITQGYWRDSFATALEAAGVIRGPRRLTPHSLRHSLNTHLLEAGVDPLRIQLYFWGNRAGTAEAGMGSRITPIQVRYTHFQAEMTQPVAQAIGRLYNIDPQKMQITGAS